MSPNTPNPRHRALASESGSIIILTALSMVVLLGILAFAVDASFLYTERNRMAAAADDAAKSAAVENIRRPSASVADLTAFANRQVLAHGFDPGVTTSVTVNRPPVSPSPFAGDSHFVEARVSRPTPTFFARVVNAAWGSVTPMARAVAGAATPLNCFITNHNLTFGNDTYTLNGCGVGVGGDLSVGGAITGSPAPPVSVSGTCSGCPPQARTGQPPPIDPLAGLAPPTVAGGCIPAVANPLPPGCYTTIGPGITTLQSGTFKVTGKITTDNLTGNGVLLYLTSTAEFDGGNNGSLNLTAGNTAPYAGIAIYGDAGAKFGAKNHFTMNINGAVYMPGTAADFKNHMNIVDTGCSLFVFDSFTENNGNGGILETTSCASSFSNANYLSVALAE